MTDHSQFYRDVFCDDEPWFDVIASDEEKSRKLTAFFHWLLQKEGGYEEIMRRAIEQVFEDDQHTTESL